ILTVRRRAMDNPSFVSTNPQVPILPKSFAKCKGDIMLTMTSPQRYWLAIDQPARLGNSAGNVKPLLHAGLQAVCGLGVDHAALGGAVKHAFQGGHFSLRSVKR